MDSDEGIHSREHSSYKSIFAELRKCLDFQPARGDTFVGAVSVAKLGSHSGSESGGCATPRYIRFVVVFKFILYL